MRSVPKREPWAYEGRGPREFRWQADSLLRWQPSPQTDVSHLVSWVREGVPVAANQDNFQTDGRLYVYSTLRPSDPPEGSLQK